MIVTGVSNIESMEPLACVTRETWETPLLLRTEDVSDVVSTAGAIGCGGAT